MQKQTASFQVAKTHLRHIICYLVSGNLEKLHCNSTYISMHAYSIYKHMGNLFFPVYLPSVLMLT